MVGLYVALYGNCTANIEQLSNLTFSNNTAYRCGGALHFSHHCKISFTGNSFTLFANNRANRYGGAVCFYENSSVKFEKNSTAVLEHNNACFGENIYSKGNSVITLTKTINLSIKLITIQQDGIMGVGLLIQLTIS